MALTSALFKPVRVGNVELNHRIVLAPLTRYRADIMHTHGALAVEYYTQRAGTPGSLLITEATYVAAKAAGQAHAPGVFSDAQVAAWKKVVEGVHARGAYIFLQIWALGRAAFPADLSKDAERLGEDPAAFPYVSSGDVQLEGRSIAPRPLEKQEIHEYVGLFATAARNAVERAGFDGVEVHGANGYLVEQFTSEITNNRTDEYGGSVENRTRFALEIVKAVSDAVGQERTAFRISPFSKYQDVLMPDPVPTFTYLVTELRNRFPHLAYLHAIEPRMSGDVVQSVAAHCSLDFVREIWKPRPLILAGGFNLESAQQTVENSEDSGETVLIAFGRNYISNPDLPKRLKHGIPLAPSNRATYYTAESPVGYIDYPAAVIPEDE